MSTTSLSLATLVVSLALAALWVRHAAGLRQRRAQFIETYRFPEALRRRLSSHRPGLDADGIDLSLEALRQYFLACLAAQQDAIAREAGMPSVAADDAWHEFILMTRDYSEFCEHAFGGYLHHHPADGRTASTGDALANTLHQLLGHRGSPALTRQLEGLPLLFALDGALGVDAGNHYDAGAMEGLDALRRRLVARRLNGSDGFAGCAGGVCGGESTSSCTSGSACGAGSSCGGGGCGS